MAQHGVSRPARGFKIGANRTRSKRNLGPGGAELRSDMKLMEDLGYDSLAVAETVFFFEDLFKVRIQNTELMCWRLGPRGRAGARSPGKGAGDVLECNDDGNSVA